MFSRFRARFCAALLVLASIIGLTLTAATLTAPPAGAAVDPNPIATAIYYQLNAERARNYLPPLLSDYRLRNAAHGHNLTMARWNTLSHQEPGEAPFYTRITNAGFHWSYCAENIAWNYDMTQAGGLALETMMYNEKPPNIPHLINILSRTYTYVGVDVYLDLAHHKLWLTEDFARP
jgi:uncharacterized protein YkwD